jgi:hypothetical protein
LKPHQATRAHRALHHQALVQAQALAAQATVLAHLLVPAHPAQDQPSQSLLCQLKKKTS